MILRSLEVFFFGSVDEVIVCERNTAQSVAQVRKVAPKTLHAQCEMNRMADFASVPNCLGVDL
jgi:hypothetical protein